MADDEPTDGTTTDDATPRSHAAADTPTGLDRDPEPAPVTDDPPAESLRTRLWRYGFNLLPAYRGTGARVDHIAADWRYLRVRIPFNWRTKNGVGATFGGSLYGAVDPVYMTMFQRILGDEFTIWDKAAAIEFLEPGRETLYAEFELDETETERIRESLSLGESTDREYLVRIVDDEGTVHAICRKTLYVRRDR